MLRTFALFAGLAFSSAVSAEDVVPAAEPAPSPLTYTVDPGAGLLFVRVFKDPTTVGAGLSHDHAIQARGYSGSFTWDPASPGSCKLDVTVPVAQLDPDTDSMRKTAGIEGVLDADQRSEVKEHMLAEDQLNAAKYPNITFKASSCSGGPGSVKVQGDLTIRGKTKSVVLSGNLTADDGGFRLKGTLPIKATDFGFQPFSALFGALKNQNDMKLEIDLRGKPR